MNIGIMVRTIDEKQGIGIYTINLLDNMLSLDKENKYVLFYYNTNYFDRYSSYPSVTRELVTAGNKLLWDQFAIPRAARKYKLDIIFNTKFSVPLFSPCPTAMVMHGSEWFVYPKHYKASDIRYQKIMMKIYLKRASLILSVSDRAKLDMIKYAGGDPGKFRTVHLAANDRFMRLTDEKEFRNIKEKYGLPDTFLLWVGRIYPGKNVGALLEAFKRIMGDIPHKLMLVGGLRWDYENELRLINSPELKGRVTLLDWVDPEDLPAFYSMASAFVFPSWYESCPAPPWEAMGCGCPVVTTKGGGTPEVVGDAAYFVDPSDPRDIGEGILRVINDRELREALIIKGHEQLKKFTWEKCARETLDAIKTLRTNV